MSIAISKEEIKEFMKLNVISQITLIKEKIKFFENKYKCSFEDFEKKIKETEKEDFERWDDYIEWKAYIESLKDLEEKLRKIEDARDIKVT